MTTFEPIRRWLIVAAFSIACVPVVRAADEPKPAAEKPRGNQPSEEQLKQWLKQFPDADFNKDGVLTIDEARAYREKAQARRGNRNDAAAGKRIRPTMTDVHYGPHERQVFDFYKSESKTPTPLIVYIHGGGFVGGDKNSINQIMLERGLADGISFASLHYRFVNGEDIIFPTPQLDSARALQFIRSKATEWNIDPTRVACYGGSAGAGISMWLGFHDDLADPKSDDPIARQSTRISAVGTMGGQSTYDPIEIKRLIGGRAWEHPSIFKVYGVKSADEALSPTPEKKKLYDEASAITHLTKDDAPLYMTYNEADGPLPENARPGQGIHHPNFGRQLKEEMDSLGIENVFVYTPKEPGRNTSIEMLEFFEKHFGMKK